MTGRRGFSLAEMLVTIALMTLLLGSMAVLIRAGVSYASGTTVQVANTYNARVALQSVLCEFRQAVSLEEPASGSSGASVAFTRLSPDGSGTPMHVRWAVADGTLYRKTWLGATEPADDPGNESGMLNGMFSATFTAAAGPPVSLRMRVTADQLASNNTLTPQASTLDGVATPRGGR